MLDATQDTLSPVAEMPRRAPSPPPIPQSFYLSQMSFMKLPPFKALNQMGQLVNHRFRFIPCLKQIANHPKNTTVQRLKSWLRYRLPMMPMTNV